MNVGENGRRVVDGRFELQTRLGGGGMGTVWRARDLLLHRSVAVKEVRPPDIDLAEHDPEGARMLRERVLREARALASVQHPNVVTIHHIVDGGEGTYPWLVMELVEGGSLADRLERGPMAPHEAARLGREVLAALDAAHAAGIQHRDVKPANVLLRPDGRPVLTDFGIAAIRESTTLTATGSIIGTPDYMAPERITGVRGGPASDLWSLAMMLYVAVEGHHPLRRGTTLATLAAVLHDDVPPPKQAGALTPVLNRVLVRDPDARPDAAELERMLAAAEDPGQSAAPATSYHLAPPGAFGPATGFGPPTGPRDAVPPMPTGGFPPPAGYPAPAGPVTAGSPYPPGAVTTPVVPKRPGRRGLTIASSAVGVALVGVLVWTQLPSGGTDDKGTGADSSASGGSRTGGTPTPSSTASAQDTAKVKDLLTPDGIRTALKAIEKKTGSHLFADFTVYPEYVSASVIVKGSRTAYDDYTYRPGTGVEKGIISNSADKGEVVDIDDWNWDAVPALLSEARKKLKVPNEDTRYLVVNPPDTTFDTPANMAIYLNNKYSQGGYLEADPHTGKVTTLMPYDEGS
ncbi:serine/threonine-protein kinase [Streptomyces mangrovisoli]|uniref:non-specific serine/threonine protein kinase n=1 Tax=Streptomyces mangrovisoli TaxID=1428628 RepID=A0A1J4NVN7_9ACTN|nr:serine/threonine-protein kinase [Streptomyces mangrovisoli]OIJ66403.1 serine/threonine protein kinase [Streptomyces mangrovisoli]